MRRFEASLLSGVVAICAAAAAVLLYALWSLGSAEDNQRDLAARFTGVVALAQDVRNIQAQRNGAFPLFLITADPVVLQEITTLDRKFDRAIAALRRSTRDRLALASIANIEAGRRQLLTIERPGIARRMKGEAALDIDSYFRINARPIVARIDSEIARFVDLQTATYQSRMSADRNSIRFALRTLGVAAALSLVFCAGIVGLILRLLLSKRTEDALIARLASQEKAISLARKEAVETVAHDLRNPLAAITMIAERLRARGAAPADARSLHMLEGLQNSAATMNLLIANILDHAKIGVGPLALELAPCSLHAVAVALLSRFYLLAEARDISICNNVPPDLPSIDVDRMRIEQVISNLVGNAIKFTPRGGSIELDAAIEDKGISIQVVDTGRGMDEAQIQRVFDRHWQAAETASAGSGLGLAISKAIVEAHGGSITAHSNVGKGTCFSFFLPLHQRQEITTT